MTVQQVQNPTFFPTPKKVIETMLMPHLKKLRDLQILEPSAGAGDILDFLYDYTDYSGSYNKHCNAKLSNLYAIEQDEELVFQLQGKGYKVIHNDFLTYSGDYLFDLIVMNPPFINGDEHLLKAWEVMKTGHIVCLLNEETVLNTFSSKRKLLKNIIDEHGSIEFLGEAFAEGADRKTDCRIALVRLEKKEVEPRFTFEFGDSKENHFDLNEEIAGDSIAMNDLTGAMLRQYEKTKQAYVEYIRAKKALNFYSSGLVSSYDNIGKMADEHYGSSLNESYNGFVSDFKSKAWTHIISKLGLSRFMTHGVQQDFEKFKKSQGAMDLTRENIFSLVQMLVNNRVNILDKAIVDVFDIFTKYHNENRLHVEGWKTNSAWKVNKKIILPYWVKYGEYYSTSDLKQFGSRFSVSHSRFSEYSDIDKVLCYITGRDYSQCYTLQDALRRRFDVLGSVRTGDKFDNEGESEFFTYKFWKKGTLHIEFKDSKLWEEFNYRACKDKNWLPAEEYRKEKKTPPAKPQPS